MRQLIDYQIYILRNGILYSYPQADVLAISVGIPMLQRSNGKCGLVIVLQS